MGAAIELEPRDVAEHLFEDYHFLHIEGYLVQNKSLIQHALQTAKKKGLQVSLDLASFNVVEENRDFLHEIVKNYVDILFANEEEAKAFTGLTDGAALHRLSEFSNVAVLKLGSKGSIIKHQDRVVEVAATEAVSRDTTGAGDLYASGFLFGLIHGLPIEQCGEIASLLAGRVIEVIGPKIDDQAWKDINQQVMKYVN
ncbi:pfkB family carbohydrate kinase [Thermophagus xiamenensis]|uniref:PfkB family carbohydrate kinase n=1 Tax=Thermophagus xiamenensis TaxID=385682 RepID=A0A1I2E7J3_9BACT|nr:pfkB family carbohydrate kinase [Thermophagus xiamenensis]